MKKILFLSSILFLLCMKVAAEPALPKFSSANNADEHWYYIWHNRKATINNVVHVWGFGTPYVQAFKPVPKVDGDLSQHWKFVGDQDNFYLVNRKNGYKVIYTSTVIENVANSNSYYLDVDGSGTAPMLSFKINPESTSYPDPPAGTAWTLWNNALNTYLNDAGSSQVCSYGGYDTGAPITFFSADEQSIALASKSVSIEAPVGYIGKVTVSGISGTNLTADITATITGDDASAFDFVSGNTVPKTGGELAIKFTPTDSRTYNATLTLTSGTATPVIVSLVGAAISATDLPVTGKWYYIQFARRKDRNTVWSLSDTTQMIVQDTLRATAIRDNQQWKIEGNWTDGFYFINKAGNKEMEYNQTAAVDGTKNADRYYSTTGMGNTFDLVRFKSGSVQTEGWQLYNKDVASASNAAHRYMNDQSAKFMCHYAVNDAGNRLIFIPAEEPAILAAISQGTAATPVTGVQMKTTVAFEASAGQVATKQLLVTGLNLTGNITASFTGNNAAAFGIEGGNNTLPATGDVLNITFSPTVIATDTVTLHLTSGSTTAEVTVIGNSDLGLPEFSNAQKEVWYYVQFARRANTNKVWQGNGDEQSVTQAEMIEEGQEGALSQHWKFTGTVNNAVITNREGGNVYYNGEKAKEEEKIILFVLGHDHKFYRANSTSKWKLQNIDVEIADKDPITWYYLNDFGGFGTSLGFYSQGDAGAELNFIKVEKGPSALPSVDADDSVVDTRYYTLFGYEVIQPATTGVYIVKETLASGKTRVSKQLFIK